MSDINLDFQGTPGEWVAAKNFEGEPCVLVKDANRSGKWEIENMKRFVVEELAQDHTAKQDANLIAAAPELLEACIDRDNAEPRTIGNALQRLAFELEIGTTENIKEWIAFLHKVGKKQDVAVCKALGLPNQ